MIQGSEHRDSRELSFPPRRAPASQTMRNKDGASSDDRATIAGTYPWRGLASHLRFSATGVRSSSPFSEIALLRLPPLFKFTRSRRGPLPVGLSLLERSGIWKSSGMRLHRSPVFPAFLLSRQRENPFLVHCFALTSRSLAYTHALFYSNKP